MATAAYREEKYCFRAEEFFAKRLFAAITEVRVDKRDIILAEARSRRKRPRLRLDGKLVIVATDHAGRKVSGWGSDLLGVGDLYSYLVRTLRVPLTAAK